MHIGISLSMLWFQLVIMCNKMLIETKFGSKQANVHLCPSLLQLQTAVVKQKNDPTIFTSLF